MSSTHRPLALLAAVPALLLALAGCTSPSETGPVTGPSPTEPAVSTGEEAPPTGVCDAGQLTIVPSDLVDGRFTVDEACDVVAVVTDGAQIDVEADVETLTIEGSSNEIVAEHVQRTFVTGQGNRIEHTGDAPEKVDAEHDDTEYVQR